MKDIQNRLAEIPANAIARTVYQMANSGTIEKEGADKSRVYFVVQKKANEKQIEKQNT